MMFGRESCGSSTFIDVVLDEDAVEIELVSRVAELVAELIVGDESDIATKLIFKFVKCFGASVPGRPGGENER